MILAFFFLLTNLALCLCTDYYAEYNPLWSPGDVGLSHKLFYKENDSAVPVDVADELMNPKTPPTDLKPGEAREVFSFEIRVPEHIRKQLKEIENARKEKPTNLRQRLMSLFIGSPAQEKSCGGMRYVRKADDGSEWHVTVKVWSKGSPCDTMAVADAISDRIDQDVAIAHASKMKQWNYSIDEEDWRVDIRYTKEGYNLDPWGPPRIQH